MRLAPALLSLALGACSLAPDFTLPTLAAPEQWHAREEKPAAQANVQWDDFASAELRRLTELALANNNDLAAALARVAQARATARIAGAAQYPQLDASGGLSQTNRRSQGRSTTDDGYDTGATISYEVDLWAKNRNSAEAARWQQTATQYERDALALTVTAEVARLYTGVLGLDAQLAIARSNLKNAQELLRITTLRYNLGADSGLPLAQQRTAVASTEASIDSLQQQRALFFNQLALMTGTTPAVLAFEHGETFGQLRMQEVPLTHPWELLQRRPDIASAEANLRAANLDIGVARAQALPSLSLGLDAAISGAPATRALGLAASFFAPIFRGGALQGEIERTEAVRNERIANYRQVLLVAFREVEDALATLEHTRERRIALERAAAEAETAYRIARAQHKEGSVAFNDVLSAQASLLNAQTGAASARQDEFAAATELTRALGGGWQRKLD